MSEEKKSHQFDPNGPNLTCTVCGLHQGEYLMMIGAYGEDLPCPYDKVKNPLPKDPRITS